MSDYDQEDMIPARFTRGNSLTIEQIILDHYRQVTQAVIGLRRWRELKEAEDCCYVLEMELTTTRKELKETVNNLRNKQNLYRKEIDKNKEDFKNVLKERLEVIISCMGVKGLLPVEEVDEEV